MGLAQPLNETVQAQLAQARSSCKEISSARDEAVALDWMTHARKHHVISPDDARG
jgi:hypothetical protein